MEKTKEELELALFRIHVMCLVANEMLKQGKLNTDCFALINKETGHAAPTIPAPRASD